MAQHSFALLLSLAAIIAFSGASRPHIIGGSANTDDYLVDSVNGLLKSVISNIMSSRSGASVQDDTSNDVASLTNGDQGSNSEDEDNRSALSFSVNDQLIRVRLPPAAFSGTDQINPFTRMKRQACSLINGKILDKLISSRNNTLFIGRTPLSGDETIPANQSLGCPNSMNNYSTSPLERLRSNCPWRLERHDLGVNSYPRFVAKAACLCQSCIETASHFNCKLMKANTTYFELLGCQDNLALLVKKTAEIPVGCFCAGPEPATRTEQTNVQPTFDG